MFTLLAALSPHCSNKRTNKVSNNQACIDAAYTGRTDCTHYLTCVRHKRRRLPARSTKSRWG